MNAIAFTTQVKLPEVNFKISHQTPLLLLGSCFTQNIGAKLVRAKFNATTNPFGIIYNPISIAHAISEIVANKNYTANNLISYNKKWLSLNHHGSFSDSDKKASLEKINYAIKAANQQIKKANVIFITFGTAWVYEHKNFGIVANCHKMPAKEFTKRLLNVGEIVEEFNMLLKQLFLANPKLKIVFTVSPIRHVKDGLHENNLSKSVLHLAIKNIIEQNKNCSYFPAYELIMDELRDYRFFKDDLTHPTPMAINYVWEKFSACYFNNETKDLNKQIKKIVAAANHQPFDFDSEAHQKFVTAILATIKKIQEDFPFLNFEREQVKIKR